MSMRERLTGPPVPYFNEVPPVHPRQADINFIRRIRDHLSDPKLWRKSGTFLPEDVEKALEAGFAVPVADTPCCLLGAVWLFLGYESIKYEQMLKAAMGFWSWGEMTRWNDSPDTTHEMLMARLDEAIARLEAS